MRIILLILTVAVVGYFIIQKAPSKGLNQLPVVGSSKISRNRALENVKKLPEVQDYLKRVPSGKVEVDNEEEGEYNVHVYEVKNDHTATFNWYKVSIKNGEVSEKSF